MSTETLNTLIKEVNSLTPQERRELIDRLAQGLPEPSAPDFDDSAISSLSTHENDITADTATLREWLKAARYIRAELPVTSDSVVQSSREID